MTKRKTQQTQVRGRDVSLRAPRPSDAAEFFALTKSSTEFHKGLVNPPGDYEAFNNYVAKSRLESERCFLIIRNADERITGAINLSQIFYGGFKNAYLGYYLFEEFIRVGIMTEALDLVIRFAFLDLKLHRLEANIQPSNKASISLVKRCGFSKEGYSQKYLKLGGKWRDHERWAIIKENWDLRNKKR